MKKETGETDTISLLMRFGLTNQEARIYRTLCAEGKMTGYEAAKATGISRSNIYTALAGLVEKGAACLSEENVTRYSAVPAKEFCDSRIESLRLSRDELIRTLPAPINESEGYLTVVGEENIIGRMRAMLRGAEMRVYASMSAHITELLRSELEDALGRGLEGRGHHRTRLLHGGSHRLAFGEKAEADSPDCRFLLRSDRRPVRRGIFHLPLLPQEKPHRPF